MSSSISPDWDRLYDTAPRPPGAWRDRWLRAPLGRLGGWILAERDQLPLWLPVLLALGDGIFFALPTDPMVQPWVAAGAVGLGVAWVCRGGWGQLIGAAGAAIAAGFLAAWLATMLAPPLVPLPSSATVLSGRVGMLEDLPDGSRRATILAAEWPGQSPIARSLRMRLPPGAPGVAVGDVVRARAMLRPPPAPAFPGAWDLQREAFFAGKAGSATPLGAVEIIAHAPPAGIAAGWRDLRTRIAGVAVADLGPRVGGIAATLLTGLGAAIPAADREAFRASGLAHLLAVAGLHVGAVMGVAFLLTRWLLARSEQVVLRLPVRPIAAAAALLSGFVYMCLTGAHVPIQRSFAMACVVTLALLVGRRPLSLRGLAVAAGVILLISPEMLLGVGFQMSFAAVLALIAGYRALRPLMERWAGKPVRRHLVQLTLTSVLAGTASIPFTMAHFGQVQLWFVFANLVAVPITSFAILPLGMLGLALMPFGLEQVALQPMGWAIRLVLAIAHATAELPAATLATPTMPTVGLISVGLGMAWLGLWSTRVRLLGVPLIAMGLISPWLASRPDILVSADGRMMGLYRGGAVEIIGTGQDRFTLDQWEEYWGSRESRRLGADPAGPACGAGPCRVLLAPGAAILVATKDDPPGPACAAVVLTIALGNSSARCPGAAARLGREGTLREGATAVWFNAGRPDIVTSAGVRGVRPWTVSLHRLHPAPVVAMPMALRDEPPTS